MANLPYIKLQTEKLNSSIEKRKVVHRTGKRLVKIKDAQLYSSKETTNAKHPEITQFTSQACKDDI